MRAQSASSDDSSVVLVPPIACRHPDDVEAVHVNGSYRIFVRFYDGTSGIVDLRHLIHSNEAGVFAELREPEVFDKVEVRLGSVSWPGDIDLAPDAMYNAFRAAGEWILE